MIVVTNVNAHKGAKHVYCGVEEITPEVAVCRCSCGERVVIPVSDLGKLQLTNAKQGEWWVSGTERITAGKSYNGWFVNSVYRDFVGNVYYECMRRNEDSAGSILLTRDTLRSFASGTVRQRSSNGSAYVPGKTRIVCEILQSIEEVGLDYFSIFRI